MHPRTNRPEGRDEASTSDIEAALSRYLDVETSVPGDGIITAVERSYSVLRKAITAGVLKPGTVLSEIELAAVLQTSRTPIRTALQTLLTEQLLEPGPRRQLLVRSVSPEQERELFLLRQALEQVSVKEAAKEMPIEEIDKLRLLLLKQRRATSEPTPDVFLDLDDEFHVQIAHGATLPTLVHLLEHVRALNRLVGLRAIHSEGRFQEVVREHEIIVDSLEARDVEAAARAMAAHLASTSAAANKKDDLRESE